MNVTAKRVAGVLEEFFSLDPAAVKALVENRVPCNEGVADHASITVHVECGLLMVGVLGVVNGILLDAGSDEVVVASYLDDGFVRKLVGFSTSSFVTVVPPPVLAEDASDGDGLSWGG